MISENEEVYNDDDKTSESYKSEGKKNIIKIKGKNILIKKKENSTK